MCELEPVLILDSHSEEETRLWGFRLGEILPKGAVVALAGDLGAGKSVFARGVLRGLGVTDPYLTSPTFTILNHYDNARWPASHFDFYRVTDPEELVVMGAAEYLPGEGIALVEWPQHGGSHLPPDHLQVLLADGEEDDTCRRLAMRATGPVSLDILHEYRNRYLG